MTNALTYLSRKCLAAAIVLSVALSIADEAAHADSAAVGSATASKAKAR